MKLLRNTSFEGNGLIIVGANTYIYKQAVFSCTSSTVMVQSS